MATNSDSSWEVVDGVQRLSTIVHFAGDDEARKVLGIAEPLRIDGLEKLGPMNGKAFVDLPTPIQMQFSLRP